MFSSNGSFAGHVLEISVMLLGATLLGYLLRYVQSKAIQTKILAELQVEKRHRRTLEEDFDRLRAEHSAMGSRISVLEAELTGARAELADRTQERDSALLRQTVTKPHAELRQAE
jgi:cell division protein FtsL